MQRKEIIVILFVISAVLTLLLNGCGGGNGNGTGTLAQNATKIMEGAQRRYNGPLIDAHIHVFCANDEDCIKTENKLLLEMDKENISKAIIEDGFQITPEGDQMLLGMASRHPHRFLPFLSGFEPNNSASVDYVKTQLESGNWAGIGEIRFRHDGMSEVYKPNDPVMHQIYDLADEFDKPVHFEHQPKHLTDCASGTLELEEALIAHPNVKFIWHVGQLHDCKGIIENYPNLIVEEEFFYPIATFSNYSFNSKLIQEGRIIIGSDSHANPNGVFVPPFTGSEGLTYHNTIENTRMVLGRYPKETAEEIGYKNILSILG